MFVGLVEIISRLDKPGFVNLRKAFRRISDVWENAKTKNMEKCRLYLSPITQQFLDFTTDYWVFDLFFRCVTVETIYKSLQRHGTKTLLT